MNGKITVAPCGHTGETIIGNFVLCRQGCDGGTKVARRGEVGHVDNCACKPCQLRRITTTIIIRSKKGETIASLPWDGATDLISFTPKNDCWASDYQMLDADGKVIAKGPLDDGFGGPVGLVGGFSSKLRTKFLMDKAGFVVELAQSVKKYDPKNITITFNGHKITGTLMGKPIQYTPPSDEACAGVCK